MAPCARRKLIGRDRKAVFHCTARCVRRAFLCGRDRSSGRDYAYRRDWIVRREELLAGLFTIDIEFRAELSNHLHVVLRTRPDVARRLTPEEVARRWLTITKLAKCLSDARPEPDSRKIENLLKNTKRLAKMRRRLSDISWFMGTLQEYLARRANQEDEASGHFFEGRFRCREVTDAAALLVCGVYVDLNPYRAGEVDSPTGAPHSSIFQRLLAQQQAEDAADRADGWMAELTLRPERAAEVELAYTSRSGRRASDLGVIPVALADYVALLEWTARLLQSGQRTTIPAHLITLLDHIQVNPEAWLDTVDEYDELFCHALGPPSTLAEIAQRLEVDHLKGTAACRRVFV